MLVTFASGVAASADGGCADWLAAPPHQELRSSFLKPFAIHLRFFQL